MRSACPKSGRCSEDAEYPGPFGQTLKGRAAIGPRFAATHQVDSKVIEGGIAQMPLQRLGTTEDQAGAAPFLLSDDANSSPDRGCAWTAG